MKVYQQRGKEKDGGEPRTENMTARDIWVERPRKTRRAEKESDRNRQTEKERDT